MAPAFVSRVQPKRDDFVGESERDDAAAHGKDVGVVVLSRHPRRIQIVAQRGANATHFIRGDLLSLAAAAEDDSAISFSRNDCASDRRADRRIIHRYLAMRSHVVDLMTQPGQRGFQMLFEWKSGMVRTNRDAHGD